MFYYESMGANDIQGVANLNPRGMVDRIYVENHLTLVHTKLEDLKVLRRSPDLLNNVKIGQGQLQL